MPPVMLTSDNLPLPLPTKPPMALSVTKVEQVSADYPQRLMNLAVPPQNLWFAGHLPPVGRPTLAIVGSRAASRGGLDTALQTARHASARGWTVVSGGAFGIDAAAHEGALAQGAATFAVLGCGADVVYPDRHGGLFGRIAQAGGLLSEYAPGTPPRKGQFPARNRIIVALSDAVLLVEAARHSGALITARIAARMGTAVFAMAGSSGTEDLLHAGAATAVRRIEDIEDRLAGRVTDAPPAMAAVAPPALLPIVSAIEEGFDSAEGLARRLGMPVGSLLGALTMAELDGWVRRGASGRYEVQRGH